MLRIDSSFASVFVFHDGRLGLDSAYPDGGQIHLATVSTTTTKHVGTYIYKPIVGWTQTHEE